ncbi:flagellin N-terminal helical domain-containing protein [Halanaerobium saccharolyticum]|uniref:flagellin N-terminal helical domain-containing protein n=1 Tax=Halanaerobium saccharolyticum TaxID=43595 RepID=UPI003FCC79F2
MRINTNVAALNSYNQLNNTNSKLSKSLSRLSSGKRINGAADDAAGLAISEKMNAQTRGLAQAQRNAQDGISMIQTAEGALKESHSILQRMRELSVQSANDTNTEADRAEIQKEVDQLANELTRISNNTEFNTQTLLNGAIQEGNKGEAVFQIGSNEGQNINLGVNAMDATSLGVAGDVDVFEAENVSGLTNVEIDDVDSTGSAIADTETISLSNYTAGTTDSAASLTAGSVAAPTTDLSGISADAELTVSIDGSDYTLDQTAIQGATGAGSTIGDLESALQTAIGTAGTVSNDGSNLTIDSATSGAESSVSISITGTTTTDIDTAFGFSDAASASGTSAEDTIQLSNTSGATQLVEVDGTGTQFSVTEGDFAGVSAEVDGVADLSSIAGTESFDVARTTQTSEAATFTAEGELDTEAVTFAGIDVSSQASADAAITTIDKAIESVSGERSKLGALQNRLDHTINNLNTAEENLTAAESRISDVDMAREMMNMSKQQILSQAGTAMMAQANQLPQGVLQLLG